MRRKPGLQQNLGKRSLCIDVRNPAGLAILKELVAKVDVVVENFAPGVIARMGLDYETARSLNPRVTIARTTSRRTGAVTIFFAGPRG